MPFVTWTPMPFRSGSMFLLIISSFFYQEIGRSLSPCSLYSSPDLTLEVFVLPISARSDCFYIPPVSSVLAFTSSSISFNTCILLGSSCSSMQNSCLCLISCTWGWSILELGRGDPQKSTSSPGLLFCPGQYHMLFLQADPWRGQICSP